VRTALTRWRQTPQATTLSDATNMNDAMTKPFGRKTDPLARPTEPLAPVAGAAASPSRLTPLSLPLPSPVPTPPSHPRATPAQPLFAERFEPLPPKRIGVWRWLLLGMIIGTACGLLLWWRW